jgi:hypothetical protein
MELLQAAPQVDQSRIETGACRARRSGFAAPPAIQIRVLVRRSPHAAVQFPIGYASAKDESGRSADIFASLNEHSGRWSHPGDSCRQDRGDRLKEETRLRGENRLRPSLALRHRCFPTARAIHSLPKGVNGPGTMLNDRVGQLTTQWRCRAAPFPPLTGAGARTTIPAPPYSERSDHVLIGRRARISCVEA